MTAFREKLFNNLHYVYCESLIFSELSIFDLNTKLKGRYIRTFMHLVTL